MGLLKLPRKEDCFVAALLAMTKLLHNDTWFGAIDALFGSVQRRRARRFTNSAGFAFCTRLLLVFVLRKLAGFAEVAYFVAKAQSQTRFSPNNL